MRRKTVSGILLTLFLIGMLALAFDVQQAHASPGFVPGTGETTKINLYDAANPGATPVVYPDGQAYIELNDTYALDDTFTVIANVTSVTNLRGYVAGVTYDNSILECTSYEEGEFFYRAPAEYRQSIVNLPLTGDGTGYLGAWNYVTWALKKPGNVSGTGILAVFNFKVVGYGVTLIDIIISGAHAATLADPNDVDLDFNTIDIIFDNMGFVVSHELSVSVEAPDVLRLGESSLLNATVENMGLENETDVELFLFGNGTILNNATIPNLVNGTSYTINYTWTPTVEATYNITAYVVPVPDEQTTTNNVDTKLRLVLPSYWCLNHPVVWDDVTYHVGTCSNATVSDLTFSQPDKAISFALTAPWYETTGDYWCNVTIPKVLLDAAEDDRWVVEWAGVIITSRIVSSNDTHTFIYFVSWASPWEPTEVDITGTLVIGELLIIHSSPTGVTFAVDGVPQMTPWSRTYSTGISVSLVMPETHNVYEWSHWQEDGDLNRMKTVTMDTDITLTAVYTQPRPVGGKATPINIPMNKPETPALWIWLTTIILSLAVTIVYIKERKRKTESNP